MKFLILLFFIHSPLIGHENIDLIDSEVVQERMISMQKLNKLMSLANKKIKKSQLDDETVEIFSKIEHIFIDYPSLFPDDSFQGVTKASTDIIDNRDVFNALANEHAINAGLAIESVKAEDIDQLKIYFNNLYSSCKSCHSRFRN
jgi:cytochrome c556